MLRKCLYSLKGSRKCWVTAVGDILRLNVTSMLFPLLSPFPKLKQVVIELKEVCSLPIWMCFMFEYMGAPKLSCVNSVTTKSNCCANMNEDLFSLFGSMDIFNFLYAVSFCSSLWMCISDRYRSGDLRMAVSPASSAWDTPFAREGPMGWVQPQWSSSSSPASLLCPSANRVFVFQIQNRYTVSRINLKRLCENPVLFLLDDCQKHDLEGG